MMTPIQTIYRDEALALRWLPGSSSRLVVVFTGLKLSVGGESLDEFAGSVTEGGTNKVLFVTDRRATWYAAPGLWSRIVEMVEDVCDAERVDEVLSLGNSMGGYGALLLARDLEVRRAVAFAPQVTMDKHLLDDVRWPDVATVWGPLPVPCIGDTIAGTKTEYLAHAGSNAPQDVAHLDRLPDHPRLYRRVWPRGRHNLARSLKDAGLLKDVISASLRGDHPRIDALYDTYANAAA